MEIVFNEVSIAVSEVPVFERLKTLRGVVRALGACGVVPNVLRCARDTLQREVVAGRVLAQELAVVNSHDRELKIWLRLLLSKAPYIEDLVESSAMRSFSWDGQPALGAGFAYAQDLPLVSLSGDSRFCSGRIEIAEECFSDDAEILLFLRTVPNFSVVEHVEACRESIAEKVIGEVACGKDLVEQNMRRTPRLIFCGHAVRSLERMTGNEPYFREICRHFRVLHQSAERWENGPFKPNADEAISWSSESEPTLKKFGGQRTFVCPDGESRVFSLHTKIYAGNQRVYFMFRAPDVWIGYVGDHLDVVSES